MINLRFFRLVDDIASHVRLYKRARLMQKTKLASSDNTKTSFDLESLFFDAEVAMEEGQVCRDLVCTIHQDEINYLQVTNNIKSPTWTISTCNLS